MIRVLIVDDSPTARALLASILASDPELEVIGEARDGVEAVELTRDLHPDVIAMDVRMPRLDGFGATKEIMMAAPTPIVLVTASVAVHEVETSMNALQAGALALLPKPPGPASPAYEESARQLLTTVKAMSQVKVVRHWRPEGAERGTRGAELRPARPSPKARVVAIATSTGGPAALHGLLTGLPADFAAPVLVVQHIAAGFTTGLADWLHKVSPLRVKLAEDGEPMAPGTVYLAPDNRHLGVAGSTAIALSDALPVGGFRPSGTILFESVARGFGPATVAVILTGMGEDGVAGLYAIHQAGGRILAQDEKSCVVFGMPGAAIAAGLADLVLPLEAMAPRIVELVRGP
jgi:two-component system chemotaxis response regulator CheB